MELNFRYYYKSKQKTKKTDFTLIYGTMWVCLHQSNA